jgi:tetratricopeptide (TPR) repeat protein
VGEPWDAIERRFREKLATVVVAKEAEQVAKARFERPSVFGRRCPHVVDALRRKADVCRDSRQIDEALTAYAAVLREDPKDLSSRVSVAYVERRFRDHERGRRGLEEIERDLSLPRTFRDRATEALADADFLEGAFAEADARYTRLAAAVLDEDQARTLEVKALAARRPELREPIGLFLMGDRDRAPDAFVGGVALGRALERSPTDPLLLYLVGRNALQRGFVDEGIRSLSLALSGGPSTLPTPRIHREALRQIVVGACQKGDGPLVRRTAEAVTAPRTPFHDGGRRDAVLSLAARCVP